MWLPWLSRCNVRSSVDFASGATAQTEGLLENDGGLLLWSAPLESRAVGELLHSVRSERDVNGAHGAIVLCVALMSR